MTERPEGFTITTRVDGKTVTFREPIADPFVRHTVLIEDRWLGWLRWPVWRHKVEVLIDADQDTMSGVFHVLETPPAGRGTDG